MARKTSRALERLAVSPSSTAWVDQSASVSTACMKSSVTRTEWLAFWKKTEP